MPGRTIPLTLVVDRGTPTPLMVRGHSDFPPTAADPAIEQSGREWRRWAIRIFGRYLADALREGFEPDWSPQPRRRRCD